MHVTVRFAAVLWLISGSAALAVLLMWVGGCLMGGFVFRCADAVACFLALLCLCVAFWRCFLLRRGFGGRGGGVVAIVVSSDSNMLKHPRHEVLECCRGGEPMSDAVFEHMLYCSG